jgi:NAD+ diphosphatase
MAMIQDIYPHKFYNQYHPGKKADLDSIVIHFENGNPLVMDMDNEETKEVKFPKVADIDGLDTEKLTYLFSVDNENNYFLMEDEINIPEGYAHKSVKDLRHAGYTKRYRIFVAYTALQLANWYRNNKYCGRCGSLTVHSDTERAIKCPTCGNTIYPRIVPAVIVGVTNGDKLLVTKYRTGFAHYALVAGFTEIGETLEETVQREVMEEVGLKVKNIRYYKSQPWGVVDDLLAGFYCDVDGDTTINMDESELKVAEWRERSEIILQPDDYSLTNEMMTMFKENKQ